MAHVLVFGSCAPCTPGGDLLAAFRRRALDPEYASLDRVSFVDLGRSPRLTRWRAAVGIGWHGAEWRARVERETGAAVDAVVEVGDCGPRHVMSLGRMGVPAARWSFLPPADDRALWLERHAAAEGASVLFAHPDRAGDRARWLPFACDLERTGGERNTGGGSVLLSVPAPSPLWRDAGAARFGSMVDPPEGPCTRAIAFGEASVVVHLDPVRAHSDALFEALGSGARVVTTPIGPRLRGLFAPGDDLDEVASLADVGRLAHLDPEAVRRRAVRVRAKLAAAHRYEHRVDSLVETLLT